VKLHVDNGLTDIHGHLFNFYGSLDFHKNWSKAALKFGGQSVSDKCNSDNRIKVDDELNITWGHRTRIQNGNWRIGLVGVFDLTAGRILKKDFLVGYRKD
jgi:hypothetical protein